MKFKMNNGQTIPALGFGTFQIKGDEETANAVSAALKAGYRHIDTAQSYGNETGVGMGIKDSNIPRNEIFLTTKIWISNVSYDGVMTSFEESLKKLDTDYLDLLLLHQPYGDIYDAWRAMETLHKQGKVKSIGVSNFPLDRVVDLALFNTTPPAINQIEINPFHQQTENIEGHKLENVLTEAWAPFAEGRNDLFTNNVLQEIGNKHNKSIAQVIIRWLLEQNVVVLSKTVSPDRMKENLDVLDFELTQDDKQAIKALDLKTSQFFSHQDPAMIKALGTRKL